MKRGWLLLGISACLAGSLLFAKPGTVKTKDGQTLTGEIDETGDGVTVTVHNIATNIPQANVASIEYGGNIDQEYKAKAAQLGANPSAKDHLDLARWLLDKQAFDLAIEEVAKAQQLDPNNADATALFETIRNNRRLFMESQATPPAGAAPGPASTPPPPDGTAAPAPLAPPTERHYLTDADINALRQHEWRGPGDTTVVRLDNGVKQRYAATLQDPSTFNKSSLQEQAWAILGSGSPALIKDVKLAKDPASLSAYRQVQPIVLNLCARCHDATNGAAGHFGLYRDTASDAATYTNFYILLQTISKKSANHAVVDREHPSLSLLLQYSLPTAATDFHHPAVQDYHPPIPNVDDVRYKKLVGWIQDSLNPIDQKYGIDYTLPGKETEPATAPAASTSPATGPAPAASSAPTH